MLQVQTA